MHSVMPFLRELHGVAPNAKAFVVGGAVRDFLMGIKPKDIDIEVYGVSWAVLCDYLGVSHELVGANFGVLKYRHPDLGDIDISLPRRESVTGSKHTDFEVVPDPTMEPIEAARRRDYTINSMFYGLDGLYDPFNGSRDLQLKILRHTSEAFSEDPLRVLRGMQFCARFDLTPDPSTALLCSKLYMDQLSFERIREEFDKFVLKGRYMSKGLEFLRLTQWLANWDLFYMVGCPQEPEWHPEGDVWTHTCHVVDAAANIADRESLSDEDRKVLIYSALLHDCAKPQCTRFEPVYDAFGRVIRERITSKGHEAAGVEPAIQFMESIGYYRDNPIVQKIAKLVGNHLAHSGFNMHDRAIRRLACRLFPANIEMLGWLVESDHSGRPPLPAMMPPVMQEIVDNSKALSVDLGKPVPILMGRHLLPLGYESGPSLGYVLKCAYEAQLDGNFSNVEEALDWVSKQSFTK